VRLQLIDLLRQGPRSVEVLASEAGLTVANASQHLQQLSASRVVRSEKKAQRVVYRLASERVSELFTSMRDLAELVLPEMDRIKQELGALDENERDSLLVGLKAGHLTLIDVRPSEEYEAGHIPGAVTIPLRELENRLGELNRKQKIVACCRGPYCTLALEAVAILKSHGFKAYHLDLGHPDLAARRTVRRKK
jgi:rhodanese-related sulfurtransferase